MKLDKLDTFDDDFNPFQAPEAAVKGPTLIDGAANLQEAELIRRKYLNHEASVKAIAWLDFLWALLLVPVGFITMLIGLGVVPATAIWDGEVEKVAMAPGGAFVLAIGVLFALVGVGLRKLRPWARITQGVLSILVVLRGLLLLNPSALLGFLIPAYIAYLVFSEKGRMVCSPEYQRVIAATPHIKYRTHWLVKLLVAVLLLLLLLIFGIALISLMFS
jgi:hypothetical protein